MTEITYPFPFMTAKQLRKMGYTDKMLDRAFRSNQKIAWKQSPAKNSKRIYDTARLEEWRLAQCVSR